MRTRDLKALAEEKLDGYDEAMIDDLLTAFKHELDGQVVEDVNEEWIVEIFSNWQETTPLPFDWAYDEVQSELDDIGDQKYQEWKERDI
jgi:nitrate reductase assembly molybdenum cofactor insertion protein NarJ